MRAETQVRGSVAAIPAFESEAAAASFRLSLLVGQQPEVLDPRLREPGQLPAADVEIAAGLRSALLRRRPDIRQAERDLAASTAEVGVATAELFPRFSLIGGIGLQERPLGDLNYRDRLRLVVGPALLRPTARSGGG